VKATDYIAVSKHQLRAAMITKGSIQLKSSREKFEKEEKAMPLKDYL
jgi:hypothetical protein